MTPKEAFRAVIGHQQVEPLPWSIKFTTEAKERYTAHLGRSFDPCVDLGCGVVASHTNHGWTEVQPGHFRDHYGVVWNKTADRTLGIVDHPPLTVPSLAAYQHPDLDRLPLWEEIRRDAARLPNHFHMASIGFALFERAWSLTGIEQLMVWMHEEPEFIHALMARITEFNLAVIERAAAMGVDAVHLGDDWGSQRGTLIRPAMWRNFVLPYFTHTCQVARERGLIVSLHCCGNVESIMPDLIAAGVDVFDPFQPEAMDIWELRRRYRGQVAFWGGLSVQQTLPYGTVDEVRAQTRRLIREMAPGGGYILSPAHSLTGDIPPENIDAFLDEARTT